MKGAVLRVIGIEALIPQTMAGRVGGVALAVVIALATVFLANRLYSVSFFNGFFVAVGLSILPQRHRHEQAHPTRPRPGRLLVAHSPPTIPRMDDTIGQARRGVAMTT